MMPILLSFLFRVIKGFFPDFILIVTGRWSQVKENNLMSEDGGKGKWDKIRLMANALAPVFYIFLTYLGIESLVALEFLSREAADALYKLVLPSAAPDASGG